MKHTLTLVRLDEDYCNFLRKFERRVPYNYQEKKLRPFVGVLFEVHDCMYFAPLSSPKPKHLKLKSKLDFLKIDSGKLGAINFNNMLPVTERNIIVLDLHSYDTKAEEKYKKLLQEQIYWLRRHEERLYAKSKKLYDQFCDGTLDQNILKRCCDFKLLEEKCREYDSFG